MELLLIAERQFTKIEILLQIFCYKLPKNGYQWNITITKFARILRILIVKLYTNPLKLYLLWRLEPVLGCILAVLPDNCNTDKKIFLLKFHILKGPLAVASLSSRFFVVFCLFLS